jgi:hypothetical protein
VPRYEQATAVLTENGIRFIDQHYSCAQAIKEQWFRPSAIGRSISIAYNPQDIATIIVLEKGAPPALANKVTYYSDHSSATVQEYYLQLEKLKRVLKK